MQKNIFQLEQSGWWVPLIVLVALTITWLLYNRSNTPWKQWQNLILASLRFLGIFLILLLLLKPLIRQVASQVEKPIVAIAIDNSQSVVAHGTDSTLIKEQVAKIRHELDQAGLEVRTYSHNDSDSIRYDQSITDLSGLLRKVDNDLEGRNWVTTVLFTDGIYNQGRSPLYRPYPVPQFQVGLGDTIPPKDINISRVRYNRISYKGNETPIRVEVSQKGFSGKNVTLSLTESGTVVMQKTIRLNQTLQEVEFVLKSEVEGLRKLSVSLPEQVDEFVTALKQIIDRLRKQAA